MEEQEQTNFQAEVQWRKDVWLFIGAMWKHWAWWVLSILGSVGATFYQAKGGIIPSWILWLIALSGIVIAAFLAYRDERRFSRSLIQKLETHESLVIHSAIWGVEGVNSDVTDIALSRFFVSGKLDMSCEISILGDPRPNLGKILTVNYSVGGKRLKKSFQEHEIARLP